MGRLYITARELPGAGQPLFMHAAAYRFGVAVEMVIEAIGEALSEGDSEVNLDHFAAAYFLRADCDEEMNAFISDYWRGIDTTIVLDRHKAEKKEPICSIPDDHISPRRSAFFMARSVLRDIRSGVRPC